MILYYMGGGGGVWRGAKLYYIIIEWPLTLIDIEKYSLKIRLLLPKYKYVLCVTECNQEKC